MTNEEAINLLDNLIGMVDDNQNSDYDTALKTAIKALREPEQRIGHWIEKDDGWDGVYYECSVCGEPYILIDGLPSDNNYYFCPNCGADMRGDNNEID